VSGNDAAIGEAHISEKTLMAVHQSTADQTSRETHVLHLWHEITAGALSLHKEVAFVSFSKNIPMES
jgi:hypothetical protein